MRKILLLLLVGVLVLVAGAAHAEQVAGYKNNTSSNFDGLKGNQFIRTNPATVNGIGFVHTAQLDVGPSGGNFVAIGTSNGVGVDNCANDYDPRWTIFTDGQIGGVYFCNDEALDVYNANDNPPFTIEWDFCPSAGANRWNMYMGGVLRRCINSANSAGSRVIAMLETTGGSSVDRNIDVQWNNLRHSITNSAYVDWGSASLQNAPSYTITQVNSTRIDEYLAPLD
jgi:hypothetical protein